MTVTEQAEDDVSAETREYTDIDRATPKHDGVTVTELAEDVSAEMKALNAEGLAKQMRVFDSGATRNVEVDPDYHGFLSPLALHAYGEYMHRHRLQADGTMRDSDNWQKGIPNDAFVRSLVRHVHDVQLIHDGYGELARRDDRDPNPLLAHLSAALFNIQGLIHNVMLDLAAEADLNEQDLRDLIAYTVAAVEARQQEEATDDQVHDDD